MPKFIISFFITVVLFRSDKGKALSALLTDLPNILAALYGVDEPTIDLFIAFSIYISVEILCLPFELL